MKGYREPFFRGLQAALSEHGIDLVVQYGRPWPVEALRGDNVTLDPPLGFETVNWLLHGPRLMLQPTIKPWWGADLVIVEHANKHVLNHLLVLLRHRAFGKLAYWGHGRDRQGDPNSRGERFKRRSLHWADWWFAYTQGAAQYVRDQGFARERVTVVENAIDTRVLRDAVAAVQAPARQALRKQWGWHTDDFVGIYCGSLYANKRLDWLIEAGRAVYAKCPRFRLLVVGGGPQAEWLKTVAHDERAWLRYEGPLFGADKAARLAAADVWLNPGLVGLGILDAFAASLPLLTTDLPLHSPEIEYLGPGMNGLSCAPAADAFAAQLLELISDPRQLTALKSGAALSGRRYSVETMVRNFAGGVVDALTPQQGGVSHAAADL